MVIPNECPAHPADQGDSKLSGPGLRGFLDDHPVVDTEAADRVDVLLRGAAAGGEDQVRSSADAVLQLEVARVEHRLPLPEYPPQWFGVRLAFEPLRGVAGDSPDETWHQVFQ